MKITHEVAIKLANKFKINLNVVPIDVFLFGLNVELEHRNITRGNHTTTAKIVIDHLKEDPKYYQNLRKMEARRERYWQSRTKPSIFK